MKKRVWSMLLVAVLLISMLPMSALAADPCAHVDANADNVCDLCSEAMPAAATPVPAHEHAWTGWDNDASHHWNTCTAAGCTSTEKMNYAPHNWVKDEAASAGNVAVFNCVCGESKTEHQHTWATTYTSDGENHWFACTDPNCTEKNGVEAHAWTKDDAATTVTNIVYKCKCGQQKNEHQHQWATTYTYDSGWHWYACSDPACGEKASHEAHIDANGSGRCDGCKMEMTTGLVHKELNIWNFTTPAEGAAVDFDIDYGPWGEFGNITVKWNRVTNLASNASVALGQGATFAAGEMYNTSITMLVGKNDKFENFTITLNGMDVPYYESYATFQKACAVYDGKRTEAMAYVGKNSLGQAYLQICVMYAKLPGEHTHVFGSEWIETSSHHYLQCTGCDKTKDKVKHYDNNKTGLCDVCGYNMAYFGVGGTGTGTATGTHTHTWSSDYVEDISNHWKQCTICGTKNGITKHFDGNNTGKCDVCGYVMTAASGHTHTFATEWTETAFQHYKVCSCGAKNEIAAHADLNNTGLCDVCGYKMTAASTGTGSNNTLGGNNTVGTVPSTGDNNATFLWLAALIVSVCGLGGVAVAARKRKES